MTYNVLVGC